MRREERNARCLALFALSGALLCGCGGAGEEELELAAAMSQMQLYTDKLGYAVGARNAPLASFYLHEIEELSERIARAIPTYEGHDIRGLLGTMFDPQIDALEASLEAEDWGAVQTRQAVLIASCNMCHSATDHGFIVIEAPRGDPPWGQRFEPATAREADEGASDRD